ncbi:hypothetical protein M3E75_02350 [Corynebacterium sanguinis]|uniref:hypothetical protein n=1 Tax=Corynebacterium sanguinis TaxID=2594913 RepID=UPI00223A6A48|nr:hypothetical protein [Corynebacterium sanguinis]MCT1554797.1 hypothetical protein [Corynebacterium sanguinis]MCT1614402.1 hypothetical protein [Corynebacterium sanguinis]
MDQTSSTVAGLIEGSSALQTASSFWTPIAGFVAGENGLFAFMEPFVTLADGLATLLGLIA